MNSGSLSSEAGDKQAQTVTVDENTSFRKRREDVTLADVR